MSAGGRRVICTPWVDPAAMRTGGPAGPVTPSPKPRTWPPRQARGITTESPAAGAEGMIATSPPRPEPSFPDGRILRLLPTERAEFRFLAASRHHRPGGLVTGIESSRQMAIPRSRKPRLPPSARIKGQPPNPAAPLLLPAARDSAAFSILSGLSGNITGRIRGCRFPYRPTGRNGLGRSATGSGGWRRDSPRFPDPRSPRRRAARHRNGGERPRADGPG